MDLNSYDQLVDRLASDCISSAAAPQDLLERFVDHNDPETLQAITLRGKLSDRVDAMRVEGLLVTGFFRRLQGEDRVGAFLLCFEVGDRIEHRRFQSRLALYQAGDPLFVLAPSLFQRARGAELIPRGALGAIFDDGMVEIDRGFARLDPMLAPSIVHTITEAFPAADLYLRLDPEAAWHTRPSQLLLEAVMVPANPRWWRNLGLHRGQQTGARYEILPPVAASDDIVSFIEYHVRGIRRLETITQRKEANHLTMMLEELEQRSDNLMIGRCIHWDTEAPYDTLPAQAKVMHVDLAINVYLGSQVSERLAAKMNEAQKVKTPVRRHLLRVEKASLEILPLLSFMFLKSYLLRRDLFSNQFGYTDPASLGDGGESSLAGEAGN